MATVGLFMIGCNESHKETPTNDSPKNETIVGNDRTDKGCIGSAGQSWSELKQDCIRIFDVGRRLNPLETKEGDAILSAFVLYNDDRSKIELYVPGVEKTFIIERSAEGNYVQNPYKFVESEGALYINDIKQYTEVR